VYKTIYTEVEVDVDMSDFNTDDLIEELESRGGQWEDVGNSSELIRTIHQRRRTGQDYQRELDELIWAMIGKVA
jgi:hypothetical protein